jgi:hypothetical protein
MEHTETRFARTLIFSALFLVLATLASAQDHSYCSLKDVAGAWGYTEAGTLILPTGAVSFAAVGKVNFDAAGNVEGKQTSTLGGGLSQDIVKGTYTLEIDCTGTMTVGVYNQSEVLLRTIGLTFVLDDHANETRAVVTSLVLPNSMSLPAVITLEGRRVLPRDR